MLMSVVLPAPFSPSSAWISPQRASKFTAWLATTPGKTLSTPSIATATAVRWRGAASLMDDCPATVAAHGRWGPHLIPPQAPPPPKIGGGGRGVGGDQAKRRSGRGVQDWGTSPTTLLRTQFIWLDWT